MRNRIIELMLRLDEDVAIVVLASVLVLVLLTGTGVILGTSALVSERVAVNQVEGQVVDLYIMKIRSGDDFYIVIQDTSGVKEVLQNEDALWWWKWNSADVQQDIQLGATYRFTVTGWRKPFFSWFRNIVEYEMVAPPPQQ